MTVLRGFWLVVAGCWLADAHGAETLGYAWPDGRLEVSTGDLDTTRPSAGDWQAAFGEAAARWSGPTLVSVTTNGEALTGGCARSGPNGALFMDTFCGSSWGATVLATARTFYTTSDQGPGAATHTDLVFNAGVDWVIDDSVFTGRGADFTRVAVHELGHSIGLDHTPDTSAIMYFLTGHTIAPRTDDVFGANRLYGAETDQLVALDDIDGNGALELGVVLLADDGNYTLHVRDGLSGDELARLVLGPRPLISVATAPDVTGNGSQEVVVLTRQADGAGRLRVLDLASGALVAQCRLSAKVRWRDVITIGDTDGGGLPDMVPAGLDGEGRVRAPVFDVATAARVGRLDFGKADDLVQLAELPDLNGDLVPEAAALVRNPRGVAVARIRSGADGATVANLSFGRVYAPLGLAVVTDGDGNGTPALIQLGRDAAGNVRVVRQDARSGSAPTKAFFSPGNRPLGVVALDDATGDGVPDHGVVLEKDDAEPRLKLLDGRTGKPAGTVFFSGIGEGEDAMVLPDQDGSGRAEIVVVGNRNGTFRTQTRDGGSGGELGTVVFP